MKSADIKTIQQDFQVSFRYPVHFTTGLFDLENPLFHEVIRAGGGDLPKKVLAVVDRGLYRHHPGLLANLEEYCREHAEVIALAGAPLLLPGGEAVKNDPLHVTILHQAIQAAGLCRHSYVAAVGGGALIDTVGFAAATAHRGVRLLRVPTTVLSQADAAIGVKNSVNAMGQKNFLGVFAPPAAVLNDFDFLTTLSQKDWIGGVAEAVKVALIKDADFFTFLESRAEALAQRDLRAMQQVIQRCAALHLEHIATAGDPFEQGSSRPLDFGHWAAHRLELLSGFELGHGEAVAVGIALDTTYSYLAGLLPKGRLATGPGTADRPRFYPVCPPTRPARGHPSGSGRFPGPPGGTPHRHAPLGYRPGPGGPRDRPADGQGRPGLAAPDRCGRQ